MLVTRLSSRAFSSYVVTFLVRTRSHHSLNYSSIRLFATTSITYKMPSQSNSSSEHKVFSRLPTSVTPKRYDITLKPDLVKLTFDGSETIDVTVKQPTDSIVLNALDMTIKAAHFKGAAGTVKAEDIKICPSTEVATIKFGGPLQIGDGQLSIDYTGNLNDKMKGFYRSKYTTPDGKEKYAAVTQFEPTDARRAFPCWDEPAIKAQFDITLIVPKDKVALSNTNEISVTDDKDPNLKVVKYARTPIMSTYLVAAVVGDYEYVEGRTKDGVKIRVYTPLTKAEQGRFALDASIKCLEFYNEYFKIPFPLPKMDMIAIADFSAGAMENWGLVTYRESRVLVDSQNTSALNKQMVAIVVAHELAHQWFGNLVTMEWWTHLWLNEGFASFMEYLSVASLYPEFNAWTTCVSDAYLPAMQSDGLHNSHPIEVPVGHPSEIEEIFDDISYNKGCCVIRMLHNYVSDECFRKGLHSYLSKHSYKNTLTEDLWEALEEASKKPVGTMMSTWTKQKGYPVLTVSARQDGENTILSVSQEKFCTNGILEECDKSAMWIAPVTVLVKGDSKPRVQSLLESKSAEIVVNGTKPNQWIKINPGAVDFYRVHYSQEMLSLLSPAVKDKSLAPLDRLDLQNDLFALVQAGKAQTVQILELLEAFVNEDNYTVWDSICSCLGQLNILMSNTDCFEAYKAFGRGLMSKICAKVGWEPKPNETHQDTLLRPLVLGRMVSFGDPEIIKQALERFDGHVNKKFVLSPDLRGVVYRAVSEHCDDKTFETLIKMHNEIDLHEEKNRILGALGAAKCPNRIQKVFQFAFSDAVRAQDAFRVLLTAALSNHGREAAWKFFQEQQTMLKERYLSGFIMKIIVKYTTEHFASEEKALEIENFFAKNPVPGAERTIQQSLESVRLKAAWLSRDSAAVKTFLNSRLSK